MSEDSTALSLEAQVATPGMAATYAARLTPSVSAAIATIAVRGPQAAIKAGRGLRMASGGPLEFEMPGARFGVWRSLTNSSLADEHVVVLCRHAESLEINCHGGTAITQLILDELRSLGCEVIEAEKFMAMTESHASNMANNFELPAEFDRHVLQLALMRAATLKVAGVLMDQVAGALAREIAQLQSELAQGKLASARAIATQLMNHSAFGLKLIDPWRLTLAGPPNVGKSSLMNALCGSARVVVHAEAGTTRDAVDTQLVIAGWPVTLTDTAGIRATSESIEVQGIAAARQRWSQAHIGLIVVDAQSGWNAVHEQLVTSSGPQVRLVVLNKADLVSAVDLEDLKKLAQTKVPQTKVPQTKVPQTKVPQTKVPQAKFVVATSATSLEGVTPLLAALGDYLDSQQPPRGSAVPFTHEQVAWLASRM